MTCGTEHTVLASRATKWTHIAHAFERIGDECSTRTDTTSRDARDGYTIARGIEEGSTCALDAVRGSRSIARSASGITDGTGARRRELTIGTLLSYTAELSLERVDGEAGVACSAGTGRVGACLAASATSFAIPRGIFEEALSTSVALGSISCVCRGSPSRVTSAGSVRAASSVDTIAIRRRVGWESSRETGSRTSDAIVAMGASRGACFALRTKVTRGARFATVSCEIRRAYTLSGERACGRRGTGRRASSRLDAENLEITSHRVR